MYVAAQTAYGRVREKGKVVSDGIEDQRVDFDDPLDLSRIRSPDAGQAIAMGPVTAELRCEVFPRRDTRRSRSGSVTVLPTLQDGSAKRRLRILRIAG
jgi:hypothetical protein